MECPQTIVKLYKGMMKAYVNQTSTYEGSTVVVEHQDKDQAAGLEVSESFILCGHQAFRTHIKNIAVFVHKDDRMEVAQGRFSGKEGEADLTRLESGMSFMQVRASMSMKEKLRQVRGAICENRRDIARTRLEAIAGADNPYSLISIFGQGHLAIKAGGAVYVTKCSPVEVVPRIHANCMEEIPVKRHQRLRGPHQLRDQEHGVLHTLQRCRPAEIQGRREMVLQLSRAEGVPRPRHAASGRGEDRPGGGE